MPKRQFYRRNQDFWGGKCELLSHFVCIYLRIRRRGIRGSTEHVIEGAPDAVHRRRGGVEHSHHHGHRFTVVEIPNLTETPRKPVHFVQMALAAEADQILFVVRVQEQWRYGLDGETLKLRTQPEALNSGSAADVPRRVGLWHRDDGD